MSEMLEKIAEAIQATDGRTPSAVVDAFLPDDPGTVFGVELRPFTLGTYLVLEKLNHPLVVRAADLTPHDLAVALYVCSTPSAEVFHAIANGTLDRRVLELSDRVPIMPFADAWRILQAHIDRSMGAALEMRSPRGAEKKTVASGGG